MTKEQKENLDRIQENMLVLKEEIKRINKDIKYFEGRVIGITLAPYENCGKELRKCERIVESLKLEKKAFVKEYKKYKKEYDKVRKEIKLQEKNNKNIEKTL